MGTRADFYVGKGLNAKWIGSIAWDGYRDCIDTKLLKSTTEKQFRNRVKKFFSTRDDVTLPEQGWPWPWPTSEITDRSYWFFDGKVWDAECNYPEPSYYYCDCNKISPYEAAGDEGDPTVFEGLEVVEFPDMSHLKNVTLGTRSGLVVIAAG